MDNQIMCSQCSQEYCDENLPRLLVNCGHTFCESCILRMIVEQNNSYFIYCPEDGQSRQLQKKCLKNFPKNLALMKVIEAKKNNLSFKDSLIDVSKITKNQEFQEDQDANDLMAVINGDKADENQGKSNTCQKEEKHSPQICSAHNKPLQVVCIIDMEKICANCAIFGKHKGHEFKSLDEIEEDRLNYYSSILKIMEKKETISQRISNQETKNQIMGILGNKKNKMKKQIVQKFKKLTDAIEKRKTQSLKALDSIINQNENKLKTLLKINDKVMKKYNVWEEKSYEKIKVLEGNDFQSKLYLLFTDQEEGGQVLDEGDNIIADMSKQQENLIKQVEVALQNIGVQYDDTIFEHINKYVDISDQAKRKTIVRVKTQATVSKSKPQKITKVNEIKPIERNMQRIKSQPPPEVAEQQVFNADEESLLDIMDEESEQKKQQIIIMKPKQTNTIMKEKSSEGAKPNFMNTSMQFYPQKKAFDNKTYGSGDFPKKEGSFNQDKVQRNKKKLNKIKVPEKYEKVLQGLINDGLQTLDFTNAELGDSMTILISQLIRGTKIRNVKFIRNKLNDEAINKMIPFMGNVITLNLSQNCLTDQVLDIIADSRQQLPKLKNIILSQNKIIERKHKNKLQKLRKLDLTVSV